MNRLQERYNDVIVKKLRDKHGYRNHMMVPRLKKIVVNVGMGEATQNIKMLNTAMAELAAITGQKPRLNRARRSVSNFKLRKGMPVGCSVTLRGERMYVFLDKLISITFPRVRDFRGISPNSFDGRGNYNLGIQGQIVFPEIDYDKVEKIHGMDISIITTAKTDKEAFDLLSEFGMPFRKS